jgi:hypothetical protein
LIPGIGRETWKTFTSFIGRNYGCGKPWSMQKAGDITEKQKAESRKLKTEFNATAQSCKDATKNGARLSSAAARASTERFGCSERRLLFASAAAEDSRAPTNEDPRTPRGFWTAVAERSGDTAFRLRTELPKRRGASLPAAVQKGLVRLRHAAPLAFASWR